MLHDEVKIVLIGSSLAQHLVSGVEHSHSSNDPPVHVVFGRDCGTRNPEKSHGIHPWCHDRNEDHQIYLWRALRSMNLISAVILWDYRLSSEDDENRLWNAADAIRKLSLRPVGLRQPADFYENQIIFLMPGLLSCTEVLGCDSAPLAQHSE